MKTPWIESGKLPGILERHEAFWAQELSDPIVWITVPDAVPGTPPKEPATDDELWTDVDYVIASTEDSLSRTYYAGDALPIHNPWLGPDQVAAWLGAEMELRTRDFTSWVKPLIDDWNKRWEFRIDPQNRWWTLYLELLERSLEAGSEKWVTTYPDLHTGIDALSALRSPQQLLIDLIEKPDSVKAAMPHMTALFKEIVDLVSEKVLPAGQGTTNWTMGWSAKRFVCIGQNDFTCMISPEMFEEFCLEDIHETCDYVDHSIYHLDGPGAVKHVPRLLEIESLDCIQWIQGAGNPPPSKWIDLLKSIQDAGKSVQLFYSDVHGGITDLRNEVKTLLRHLDPGRVFIAAVIDSATEADYLVRLASDLSRG